MDEPKVAPERTDISDWLTGAAILWFVTWGLMGLALVVFLPLAVPMHGTFPPATWTDGTAVRLFVALVAVGVVSSVLQLIGRRRPRIRALLFLLMGIVGLATIAVATTREEVFPIALAFWLGWPSSMLVIVGLRGVFGYRAR